MYGQNPVEKFVDGPGLELHLVKGSPFYTIQGEGPFSGWPSWFIRLHGCPLRCFFCDTNFSDPNDPMVKVEDIVAQLEAFGRRDRPKLAVITGGEPTRQPLDKLIAELLQRNWTVQIETAGVFWQPCMQWDGVHVVVSPKTAKVLPQVHDIAKCFKYVISAAGPIDPADGLPLYSTQVEGATVKLARPRSWQTPVYLSPMDEYDEHKNKANRMLVGALALEHGYIAGLQVHKFLDLP